MSKVRSRLDKGILLVPENIEGVGGSDLTINGELAIDSSDNKFKVRLDSSTESVVTEEQTQILNNKTIDVDTNTISNLETDNLKTGVLNTDLSSGSPTNTQIPSALAVKNYVDSGDATIQEDVDDLISLSGVPVNSVDLGVFTGDVIPDGSTIKQALQSLETFSEALESSLGGTDTLVQDLITLSGVPASSTDLGTFSGTIIPDSSTVKAALQALETEIEIKADESALTAHTSASSAVHGVTGSVVGTTDTQTLTNKTLTSPILNSPEVNTPSKLDVKQDTKANLITYALTATNGQIVFATDEKKMYQVVDTTLQPIGGGSQSLDTVFQLFAEEELSDWSTGNNATFLGGGSLAGTFVKETVAPLNGDASYKFTQAAGSLNDYLATPVQDVASRFRGTTCTLYFPFLYDGANNDIQVLIYDVTNAALIPTSTFIQNATINSIFKYNVTIPSTCEQIRVGFQVKVLDDGAIFQFDDIQLTNNTTVYATIDRGQVGEILTFSGTITPPGFLPCDGTAVSRSAYSKLFEVIGITHGQGDGSTTFNVPDYRGRFLRGVDDAAGNDPNSATRTAMNTGGNTGNNVGSVQADAFQGHWHNILTSAGSGSPYDGAIAGGGTWGTQILRAKNTLSDGVNGTPRISSETRPKNAYVNYYIRYEESSSNVLVAPDTFSTDTALLQYASSSQYDLTTLANAPVGTFITFTREASTNTRTQTTIAPTQTTSNMNANGIQIFTRAYNAASTAENPSMFAIQIGKGMKGLSKNLYKSTGKTTSGSLDYFLYASDASSSGLQQSNYNENTGILYLDAAFQFSTNTSAIFRFEDGTAAASGYLVINASKQPALTGLNISGINQIATIIDAKSAASDGGSYTANTEITRTINTLNDPFGIVKSLSSNVFTLSPGRYLIEGSSPGYAIGQFQAWVRNNTTSSVAITGTSERSTNGQAVQARSFFSDVLNVTVESQFSIRFRGTATVATTGLGYGGSSSGNSEVFTVVKIQKLSGN